MGDIARGVVVNVGRMVGQGLLGSSWKYVWMLGRGNCCLTMVKAAPDPQSSIGVEMPVAVLLVLNDGVRCVIIAGGGGCGHVLELSVGSVVRWMVSLVSLIVPASTLK